MNIGNAAFKSHFFLLFNKKLICTYQKLARHTYYIVCYFGPLCEHMFQNVILYRLNFVQFDEK